MDTGDADWSAEPPRRRAQKALGSWSAVNRICQQSAWHHNSYARAGL